MGIPIDRDDEVVPVDERPIEPLPPVAEPPDDPEVPEPDGVDQRAEIDAGWRVGPRSRDPEVPEADALDQALEVPLGDEDDA